MGIIVNRPARKVNFPSSWFNSEVIRPEEAIRLPAQAGTVQVLNGGPSRPAGASCSIPMIFLSTIRPCRSTRRVLDPTIDILRAIARGDGPDRASSPWVTPAGLLASLRLRCRITAGSIVPPIRRSSSIRPSARNMSARCSRSESTLGGLSSESGGLERSLSSRSRVSSLRRYVAAPTSLRASMALIGWPKAKPCAYSQPS